MGKAAFAPVCNNKSVCLTRSVSVVVTRNGKRKNLPNINTTQQVNIPKLASIVRIKCSDFHSFSNDDVYSIFHIACSVRAFAILGRVFYFL